MHMPKRALHLGAFCTKEPHWQREYCFVVARFGRVQMRLLTISGTDIILSSAYSKRDVISHREIAIISNFRFPVKYNIFTILVNMLNKRF